MGGAFLGAFGAGLANSMQRAQEMQTQEAYKKALIEQSKLNTKMLENKLNLAQFEQGMLAALAKSEGIAVPPMPQQQPLQATPQAQPQGLLGRLFGKPPAQPQAQTQQPMQTIPTPIQQTATATPGQPGPSQGGLVKDILMKKYFDLDPKTREKGDVARSGTIMTPQGPMFTLFDKTGKPIFGYPAPAEPYRQKVITKEGTFEVEQPKYGTGGVSQVAPPEMERTKIKTNMGEFEVLQPKHGASGQTTQVAPAGEGMTPEKAGKINLIGNAMDRVPEINELIMPKGVLNRTILAKGKNPLGIPIGEGAILYSKMYQAMDAALRMETGAQANPSEIDTKVKEYWPNAYDTEAAIKSKLSDFQSYISGAANVIDPTGELRKIRETGNVPTGTKQGKPSLKLGEQQNQQSLLEEAAKKRGWKKRPDGTWGP